MDEGLTTEERVKKYGYKFYSHEVTTEDGYQLALFQVHKGGTFVNSWAPAVLMQHGLASSADFWLKNGEASPALMLANQGFNVFLGNNRGNTYSRKHKSLDPDREEDQKEFFDFSFYEMGKYDLPAIYNKIYSLTWKSKIGYVGHSQGTTQMFSALAENHGQLRKRIQVFAALAPVVSFKYQESAAKKNGLKTVIGKATRDT